MGHTLANRYVYGKAKSNLRASVGLRSAYNIQQGKAEKESRYTSRYQNTRKQARQGKARQGKSWQGYR